MQTADIRLMRYSLAVVWIVTGILSLGIYPQKDSFILLARGGIEGGAASTTLYLGPTADIVFGLMTLFTPSKTLWQAQVLLVTIYTVIISIYLPEF